MAQIRSRIPMRAKYVFSDIACSDAAGRVTGAALRYRIRHQGLVFDTRDPAFPPSMRAGMLWGIHEGDETRYIRRYLGGVETVVELGSSLGITGSHALAGMAPHGRYVGVEANPELLAPLRATLDDHRDGRSVTVRHAAVGEEDGGSTQLTITGTPIGSHLSSERGGAGREVAVPTMTLQGVLDAEGVTGDYALISDIEGAERFFILGGGDGGALARCTRAVLELHETDEASVEQLVAALTTVHGFEILERRGLVVALARPGAGSSSSSAKTEVQDFWDAASCGEVYADEEDELASQAAARYALEPYIKTFARFDDGHDRDVLEVGVGMGADHLEWARAKPRSLTGIDLTPRAVGWTSRRLQTNGFVPRLMVGDAENLAFPDESFDLVYSWGVVHHSPDTQRCFDEIHRVLRPGGEARVMIYHSRSMVGYMLWARYALLAGHPRRTLRDVYAQHLESPGTKAYTVEEGRRLCRRFASADVSVQLTFGDLLEGAAGQRHEGGLLDTARRVWPRDLIRRRFPDRGLDLLIVARKAD
jgi:FkbM family methyltransferase